VRRLGGRNPLRFFAPPVLLASIVLSLVAIPLLVSGILPLVLAWIVSLVFLGPLAYLGLLVLAAATTPGSLADRVRLMVVLATMHLSWGAGFLVGLVRGARDVVDRSRTES